MGWKFTPNVLNTGPYLIESYTVGSPVASYTFSNIPAYYSSLRLEVYARATTLASNAEAVYFRFNGDSGANYDDQITSVNNTTVTGIIDTAVTWVRFGLGVGKDGTANAFGVSVLTVPNYANTNAWKAFTFQCHCDGGGTTNAFARSGGGRWRSTVAINAITVYAESGDNFAQYSRLCLYGMPA